MSEIAQALGTSTFYRVLKDTVSGLTHSDVSMVMRYSTTEVPTYICFEDLDQEIMSAYVAGLYRLDPVYRYCQVMPRPGVFLLTMLDSSDDQTTRYREQFLSHTGMIDDLVILFEGPGSATVAIVLERKHSYVDSDLILLQQLYPLLGALQGAHERVILSHFMRQNSNAAFRILDRHSTVIFESGEWKRTVDVNARLATRLQEVRAGKKQTRQLDGGMSLIVEPLDDDCMSAAGDWIMILEPAKIGLPPVTMPEVEKGFDRAALTPRERDIVRLIFLGYPNARIAQKLELSINTIKNHKKRLYAKLDITTERELFLTFIEHEQISPVESGVVQVGLPAQDFS